VAPRDRDPALMQTTPSTRLARVVALVFVALAIGYVVWYVTHSAIKTDASLADFVLYILQAVPSVVAILLPAVILTRHPDAWTSARTLLFGAVLYAAVQGLIILADPLQGVFETLTPASEELPFLVPLEAVYNAVILLVGALGLGYMALGLSMARRYADVGPRWSTAWFVPVATVFGTVVGVLAIQRQFSDVAMVPALVVYLGSSVVLGVLRIAVWAYFASVATRGWIAGEDPRSGWGLASLATGFVLIALVIVNLGSLFEIPDDAIGTLLGYVTVIAYAGGHLLLLAAFAVGLPEIDDVEDGDTDDFEDDEYDYDADDAEAATIEDLPAT
jgi:hypothetical protein